jgi:hypothetical protein
MSSPDQGIKKVIVSKDSFPEFFGKTQQYILRYRVLSEDKNRNSHWSPKYKLTRSTFDSVTYSIVINSENRTATTVWTPPEGIKTFDVYIKFDDEDWQYSSTVGTNMYAVIIPLGVEDIKIAVQAPTFPKERFLNATLFESESLEV